MQRGADYIVNGQLNEANLSDSVDLLMRNAGKSALGDYFYTLCYTREVSGLKTPLQLCYAADLLEFMQKILPPQMVVISHDGNILPQQTRDHIYHYRAVKRRFVEAQLAFRKHRMPDPAESSHFGRWSVCANEVLKQRAMAKQCETVPPRESVAKPERSEPVAIPGKALCQELVPGQLSTAPGSRASTRADNSFIRLSRVDMDRPDPPDASSITDPLVARQRSYDADCNVDERSSRPFDNTLRTSDGIAW